MSLQSKTISLVISTGLTDEQIAAAGPCRLCLKLAKPVNVAALEGEDLEIPARNVHVMAEEKRRQGWELIHSGDGEVLERFQVPGGWTYRSTQWISSSERGEPSTERTESMTFVKR